MGYIATPKERNANKQGMKRCRNTAWPASYPLLFHPPSCTSQSSGRISSPAQSLSTSPSGPAKPLSRGPKIWTRYNAGHFNKEEYSINRCLTNTTALKPMFGNCHYSTDACLQSLTSPKYHCTMK